MARRILVVPMNHGAGVSSACLGLAHALDTRNVAVGFAKPFASMSDPSEDASTALFRLATTLRPPQPISPDELDNRLAGGRVTGIMTEVVRLVADLDSTCRVLVLEGTGIDTQHGHADRINAAVARALDAQVLLVGAVGSERPERFAAQARAAASSFETRAESRVVGILLNRMPQDADPAPYVAALSERNLWCAGVVREHPEFGQARVGDVIRQMNLQVLAGSDLSRRVVDTVIAARATPGFIPSLAEGVLVVTPGDRHDVLMAAALAESAGTRLAGLLLTAGIEPDPDVLRLVTPALGDLPLLLSPGATFPTTTEIVGLDRDIPMDDADRARAVMRTIAEAYDEDFLTDLSRRDRAPRATGPQVEQRLRDVMSRGHLRLAMTDGDDPRVLAAVLHMQRFPGVRFTLVADPAAVEATLAGMGASLPIGVQICDPRQTDTPPARAAAEIRAEQIDDEVVFPADDPLPLGLALLRTGEVDGLIGGLREDRALFLTAVARSVPLVDDAPVLSSSRLTMLADEVVFIADTMLNLHPGAEQLACIAERTAETARLCGMEPYVGFVAPSSVTGLQEEQGTAIARARAILAERRPDLSTEGPASLQSLTGRPRAQAQPTVLVFPDVASASASAKAIGQAGSAPLLPPVLQGLTRAVNMLPSDADTETVLNTIVATAAQVAALA